MADSSEQQPQDPAQISLEGRHQPSRCERRAEANTIGCVHHRKNMVADLSTREFSDAELLRFICAILILILHYQHFFMIGLLQIPTADQLPLYSVLRLAYVHGSLAVQMFWAISGFIFFFKYAQSIHDRKTRLGQFVVYRISRLYPLHFVTLIAVAAL